MTNNRWYSFVIITFSFNAKKRTMSSQSQRPWSRYARVVNLAFLGVSLELQSGVSGNGVLKAFGSIWINLPVVTRQRIKEVIQKNRFHPLWISNLALASFSALKVSLITKKTSLDKLHCLKERLLLGKPSGVDHETRWLVDLSLLGVCFKQVLYGRDCLLFLFR